MKSLYIIVLATILHQFVSAQITNIELVEHYDIPEIEAIMDDFGVPGNILPINYEVSLYRISYYTPHPDGTDVIVSGALCVPGASECPFPLSSYQHGTVALRSDVPSFQSEEGLLCVMYAAGGYVTAAADYIGLGTSSLQHLYVHAESEANACVDLLRAARELQTELGYTLNDELIIWGYSQGGHATAALQRKIETELQDEFSLTASAPMSGPYDISGVQAEVLTADSPYPTPGYLPYVVLSYQAVYGNIYNDIHEVFIEPYASILPDLFDGNHGMSEINDLCPSVPNQMLQPDFIAAYESDANHPMRLALQDNDVMNWAPQVPTLLIYCTGDDQVNYMNTLVAVEAFNNLGSNSVDYADMGMYNHSVCAPFAMFEGLFFFSQHLQPVFEPQVDVTLTNPTAENGGNDGSISVEINSPGDWEFEWSNGADELINQNLTEGNYTLTVISEQGCRINYDFELELSTDILTIAEKELKLFPNPVDNNLNINNSESLLVQIYDGTGNLVLAERVHANARIDLSQLSAGVYLVWINNAQSQKISVY